MEGGPGESGGEAQWGQGCALGGGGGEPSCEMNKARAVQAWGVLLWERLGEDLGLQSHKEGSPLAGQADGTGDGGGD